MGLIKKQQQKELKSTVTLRNREIYTETETQSLDNYITPKPADAQLQKNVEVQDPKYNIQLTENIARATQNLPQTSMADASEELKQQMAITKSECAKLIESATKEAADIKQNAYLEGIESGKAEGMSEYAEKCAEVMDTLAEAIKQKNLIIREAEGGILQLATKIAGQIIRSEISLNQAVCLNIIAEAINKVTDRDQVIVKVSSTDLELVKRNRDRLSSLIDGVKSFSIVEDSQVEAGGCIVETNLGYIDARIHTRLEAIEAAVMKVHSQDQNLSE